MKLALLGANHKTSPLALREGLALSDQALGDFSQFHRRFAGESVVLSTCNRLEIYGLIEDDSWLDHGRECFARAMGLPLDAVAEHSYTLTGQDVINHLMRVAASLDSLVLGENEILGQVRQALAVAEKNSSLGPVLRRAFELAIHAGKRARAETAISQGTTSASHIAVGLIRDELGPKSGRLLIIGAGEVARLAAQASLKGGFESVTIISRTLDHATILAKEFDLGARHWDELAAELAAADAVVAAIADSSGSLNNALAAAIIERQNQPLTIVDLSVPRTLTTDQQSTPNLKILTIDDLSLGIQAGFARRQAEIPAVEAIIHQEVTRFWVWWTNRQAKPLVTVEAAPVAQRPWSPYTDSRFLKACRLEPVDRVPIWLMRQAGRYMAAYRKLREKHKLLDLIRDPDLATEVTLQPLAAYDLDAAIIFSDILPPLTGMGFDLEFAAGEGPVIHNPIRHASDVTKLRTPPAAESMSFTLEAIRRTRAALEPRGIPLIGFCGAPFTLASYAIEGGGSPDKAKTRAFMREQPQAWHLLMTKLAQVTGEFLVAQAAAGAQALQLFDSWVGELSVDEYRSFVQPYSRATLNQAKATGLPVIHFGTNTGHLLAEFANDGATIIGADWRLRIEDAAAIVGPQRGLQGNLDPAALMEPPAIIAAKTQAILEAVGSRPGFIFNLGHGILKETPEAAVAQLCDIVHAYQPQYSYA